MSQTDPRWEQLRVASASQLDERVRELNRLLLGLEGAPLSPDERWETFDALFREAHSLKGAARAVELPPAEQIAHALETALDRACEDPRPPDAAWFDALYRALDALSNSAAEP